MPPKFKFSVTLPVGDAVHKTDIKIPPKFRFCTILTPEEPVYRTYGELGLKARDLKKATFKKDSRGKIAIFDKGQVLLCEKDGCFSLTCNGGTLCRNHVNDTEVYRYCHHPDICYMRAFYGSEIGKPLFCVNHKTAEMVNVISKRCEHDGCTTRPSFGMEDELPRFCLKHKTEEMVNVTVKRCEHNGCNTQASFGMEGGPPRLCFKHKTGEMVDVINKRCEHNGCTTHPTFGIEGGKAQFCLKHKKEKMVDVRSKRCGHNGCKTQASFGMEGGSPHFCLKHKTEEMVDIRSIKCEFDGCTIQRRYGLDGGPPQFCFKHKTGEMVNVVNKRCKHDGCITCPVFGFEGGKPQFCLKHKKEEMVNVISKRCEHNSCTTIPCFGLEGELPRFCLKHKKEGMVDVKNKRCEHDGCTTRPNFAMEGEPARFCVEHKTEEMIDVISKKCEYDGCTTIPSYRKLFNFKCVHCRDHATLNEYTYCKNNPKCKVLACENNAYFYPGGDKNIYPIHCHDHRLSTEIELVKRICPDCSDELYYPANQCNCMQCGQYRLKILYHFKEMMTKAFLESNGYTFIYDKPVSPNGSNFRPDFYFQGSKAVEIINDLDERQHKKMRYTKEKEISRMVTIYHDIQLTKKGKEVLFIRYNPDRYKGKQLTDKERMVELDRVQRWALNLESIGTPLGVIYLFYDGYDGSNKIIPININQGIDLDGEEEEYCDEDDGEESDEETEE